MIEFDSIEKIGSATWRFVWTATTGPYRIYIDGALEETVTDTEYEVESYLYADRPPAVEVLDANDTTIPQNLDYPPRLTLQWRGVSGARHYVVEQYDGAEWDREDTEIPENGSGYYRYQTAALDDLSTAQWRVIAVDEYDNESSPLAFSALIVRNPPPPAVAMEYDDATGIVTISEAT